MAGLRRHNYPPDEELEALVERVGSTLKAAQHLGFKPPTLDSYVDTQPGLRKKLADARSRHLQARRNPQVEEQSPLEQDIRRLIAKKARPVDDLADELDVAPRRIRETIEKLRHEGYRIPEEEAQVRLEKVAPQKANLHRALFDGEVLTVGLISDTHLCSDEQALPELELAYDMIADQGIREVWHPGDIVDGLGIYRGQHQEVTHHTLDAQIEYAVAYYPKRDGVTTRLIGGNHDLQGDAGRVGLDLAHAIASQRDDIDYLGPWSAYIEMHGGAWVHLLHGSGGMSYAYSYKAQKLCDGYPAGRKPAILCPGHWHVRGNFEARGVEVCFPGAFQWRSKFMERLGLTPAVGFHILTIKFGDDGSLVEWEAKWHRFWEGRAVG